MSTRTISTKLSRRSTKQASAYRLDCKRTKLEYAGQYNVGFKTTTNLVAAKSGESVTKICKRLNIEYYTLDGPKKLARSTAYQSAKDGLAGLSPTNRRKGPPPKIPDKLLWMVAMHAEVS